VIGGWEHDFVGPPPHLHAAESVMVAIVGRTDCLDGSRRLLDVRCNPISSSSGDPAVCVGLELNDLDTSEEAVQDGLAAGGQVAGVPNSFGAADSGLCTSEDHAQDGLACRRPGLRVSLACLVPPTTAFALLTEGMILTSRTSEAASSDLGIRTMWQQEGSCDHIRTGPPPARVCF